MFNLNILELSKWMSRVYMCSLGEALFSVLPGGRKEKTADEYYSTDTVKNLQLTDAQKTAVESIVCSEQSKIFYVQGVTGSGKTEVFLQSAKYFVPNMMLSSGSYSCEVLKFFTASF